MNVDKGQGHAELTLDIGGTRPIAIPCVRDLEIKAVVRNSKSLGNKVASRFKHYKSNLSSNLYFLIKRGISRILIEFFLQTSKWRLVK